MARTYKYIDTIQVIYKDNSYSPHIGLDATDSPFTFDSWKWDERIWFPRQLENMNMSLPSLWDPQISGVPVANFQSGVANKKIDLEVLKIIRQRQISIDHWCPKIRHGNYFKYYEQRYLYGNRSVTQNIDPNDNEGTGTTLADPVRNTLQMSYIPSSGAPINAIMWMRNNYNEPSVYRRASKKVNFTGIWTSSGEQADTIGGLTNNIQWRWVDTTKNEFSINWDSTPPKLIFNQDFTKLIGKTTINSNDTLEYCEILGDSDGSNNQYYLTRFFPIADTTELTLYVNNYTTEWTRSYNIGEHGVRKLTDDPLTVYSQIGHSFRVNDSSGPNGLYEIDLDRGEITFPSDPPSVGDRLFLRYRATMEIEYEPQYNLNYNTFNTINIDPLHHTTNQGFIYLSEQDMRVASITLHAERSLVEGDNIYGPLFIGTDYVFLVATAYNYRGIPVDGATVIFYLPEFTTDEDLGRLGGRQGEITAVTDGNGQARVVYTPPRSVEELGTFMEHPQTDDSNKLNLPSGVTIDSAADIYTYRVYDGDVWRPFNSATKKGGRKVVEYKWDDTAIHPRTGAEGAYVPVQPTSVTATQLIYADDLPYTPDYPGADVDAGTGVAGSTGVLTHIFHVNSKSVFHVGYWVSAGKDVEIKAKTYSTLYNQYVQSDEIYMRLDIPTYLKGTYVSEVIGTLPYGFRLYDDYLSAASGLDGVTYLSINPAEDGTWPVLQPSETTSALVATGQTEDANPLTDNNTRQTTLHDASVSLTGHRFTKRELGAFGHRFAVNGTTQSHFFSVYINI